MHLESLTVKSENSERVAEAEALHVRQICRKLNRNLDWHYIYISVWPKFAALRQRQQKRADSSIYTLALLSLHVSRSSICWNTLALAFVILRISSPSVSAKQEWTTDYVESGSFHVCIIIQILSVVHWTLPMRPEWHSVGNNVSCL